MKKMKTISRKMVALFVLLTNTSGGQCWQEMVAGDNHNVAVNLQNSLFTSGRNTLGQLGNGNTTHQNPFIPLGNCALSVDENENSSSKVTVFPNPANDFITLNNETETVMRVKLYDMSGRKNLSKSIESTSETIAVLGLLIGMYLLKIYFSDEVVHYKIIKKQR